MILDGTDLNRADRWWFAQDAGAPVLRCSYDGDASLVIVTDKPPSEFTLSGDDDAGYREMPSLALAQMAGGMFAEVVRRVLAVSEAGNVDITAGGRLHYPLSFTLVG